MLDGEEDGADEEDDVDGDPDDGDDVVRVEVSHDGCVLKQMLQNGARRSSSLKLKSEAQV
jgi:hypothetical protein